MAGQIEGQRALQSRNPVELLLGPRLVQAFERRVGAVHVACVMLVMVQLHDLAGDVRLEGTVIVGQVR